MFWGPPVVGAHMYCLFPLALNGWVSSWVHWDRAWFIKFPSGSLICHDRDLEGCQPHKDLLILRIFLSSGWTWNSRGQKTKRTIPFSQMEAALFYSMSSLHTCSSKVIQEEGTPPDLHEPQRAWPGRRTGVARYLIMSPTMDRKRSMNKVNPVQESGPIHHAWCQLAFLELCPEIGCQIYACWLQGGLPAPCPRQWKTTLFHSHRAGSPTTYGAYTCLGRTTARWQAEDLFIQQSYLVDICPRCLPSTHSLLFITIVIIILNMYQTLS